MSRQARQVTIVITVYANDYEVSVKNLLRRQFNSSNRSLINFAS
ncbi:MAG: hypothetical protein QG568_25 [Patescibacteria group bacterium]|nr:hypothetical protein [Patescibacteria group bacterium]